MRIALVSSLNLSGFAGVTGEPELDALVPPLGILTLAAVLRSTRHLPTIIDLNFEIAQRGLGLDEAFYDNSVVRILASDPDIVGFSTMCNSFHITLEIARRISQRNPRTLVLLGGPQVSYCDLQTLEEFGFVSLILRGEAEKSLPKLLDSLEDGRPLREVRGLTFRAPEVVQNVGAEIEDQLDNLPFPAWDYFPYDLDGGFAIDVGRGCPFACDFCSTSVFFQRRFRLKSFERITAEAEWLRDNFGAKAITFVHDLFTANRKWVAAFSEYLSAERGRVSFIWSASARIDTVDRVLLDKMYGAGCRALFFGVETGSQRLQNEIGKRLKVRTVAPVAAACVEAGIEATLSFIAGFPTETEDDIRQTFDLIGELVPIDGVGIQLHLMSPQVGTPDMTRHAERLTLDSTYSDIAAGATQFINVNWFRRLPEIFPSFYYYKNDELKREWLVGADFFVRLICNNMRHTVGRLVCDRPLWTIYRDWQRWLDAEQSATPPAVGSQYDALFDGDGKRSTAHKAEFAMAPDDWLIAFARFVVANNGDEAGTRTSDEVLAFYLRYYHKREVFVSRDAA